MYVSAPSGGKVKIKGLLGGEGKTTYTFSVSMNAFSIEFPLACYQHAGGGFGTLVERYGERIRCFTPPRYWGAS
jgi:hypothetical protein